MIPATTDPLSQPERTNGSVSPAQMDTTEYPPEGQNVECDHTDDNGLCWCERGWLHCLNCWDWLGFSHAKKAILRTPECDVHEAFADALAKNHFALNYCPKCGEKL